MNPEIEARLARLQSLFDRGALSDAEFDQARREVLGEPGAEPPPPPPADPLAASESPGAPAPVPSAAEHPEESARPAPVDDPGPIARRLREMAPQTPGELPAPAPAVAAPAGPAAQLEPAPELPAIPPPEPVPALEPAPGEERQALPPAPAPELGAPRSVTPVSASLAAPELESPPPAAITASHIPPFVRFGEPAPNAAAAAEAPQPAAAEPAAAAALDFDIDHEGLPLFPPEQPPSPPLTWDGRPAPAPGPYDLPRPPRATPYPVTYGVEYPERLSRWKTALRGLLIIPVFLFLYPVQWFLFLGMSIGWTAVFLRKRYPSWLFAGSSGSLGFASRAWAYWTLQTDHFPSFESEDSPVRLEIARPPDGSLSRWRVFFWKYVLLIPHFIVLSFLALAVFVVVFLAWFAILVTGRYPRGLFAFVTGVTRWYFRVIAYFASFNDRFPPMALSAEAGPAGNSSAVVSGVIGFLGAGLIAGLIAGAVILANGSRDQDVNYQQLVAGRANPDTLYTGSSSRLTFSVKLRRAYDPGDDYARLLEPAANQRIVVFEWTLANGTSTDRTVTPDAASLTVLDGGKRRTFDAEFVSVAGQGAPAAIKPGANLKVRAVFVVPRSSTPLDLRLDPPWPDLKDIEYHFK
ncbi:MAG: DUF4389 domain-containing protein [Chloroflexi bacterium]|nr:DUF4389 domain-containing protein [Chloroflexota bacterium]